MKKYRIIETDNSIRIETRTEISTDTKIMIERQCEKYSLKNLNELKAAAEELEQKEYEFEFIADRRTDETIKEDTNENWFGISHFLKQENQEIVKQDNIDNVNFNLPIYLIKDNQENYTINIDGIDWITNEDNMIHATILYHLLKEHITEYMHYQPRKDFE